MVPQDDKHKHAHATNSNQAAERQQVLYNSVATIFQKKPIAAILTCYHLK